MRRLKLLAPILPLGLAAIGSLAPGAHGEVQMRFHKVDWSVLDESDDYSFDPTKLDSADWDQVSLYRGRTLVWGNEPGDLPPTPSGDFCTASPWDPQAIYWSGDEVAHEERQWRAKWWTQGEEPAALKFGRSFFPAICPRLRRRPRPFHRCPAPRRCAAAWNRTSLPLPMSLSSLPSEGGE